MIEGKKIDFNRLRYKFGSYGVAALPSGQRGFNQINEHGFVLSSRLFGVPSFLLLKADNWKIVTRRHFVALPSIPRQVLLDLASRNPTPDESSDYDAQSRGGSEATTFQQHASLRDVTKVERIMDEQEVISPTRATQTSSAPVSHHLPSAATLANVTPRKLSLDLLPDDDFPPSDIVPTTPFEPAFRPPTPTKVSHPVSNVAAKAVPHPKVKPSKKPKKVNQIASAVERIKIEVAEKF